MDNWSAAQAFPIVGLALNLISSSLREIGILCVFLSQYLGHYSQEFICTIKSYNNKNRVFIIKNASI